MGFRHERTVDKFTQHIQEAKVNNIPREILQWKLIIGLHLLISICLLSSIVPV